MKSGSSEGYGKDRFGSSENGRHETDVGLRNRSKPIGPGFSGDERESEENR